MKQTITCSQFHDAFRYMNRLDNFSYQGLNALYDWIEQFDDDCGTETDLDVIALCCEFTEYKNIAEFRDNYNIAEYPDMDTIQNNTIVIPVNDESFIIQDF